MGTPTAGCTFFLTLAPWSTLAAVGRGAAGEKDMSLVRNTDKLYNAKGVSFDTSALVDISCRRGASGEKDMNLVRNTDKRAGSGHKLGEVGGVAAGCSWYGLSSGAGPDGSTVVLSGAKPGRQPKTGTPQHPRLLCTSVCKARPSCEQPPARYTSMRPSAIQSETAKARCEESTMPNVQFSLWLLNLL